MLCRRGRAAASSAATRLATQLLACWASLVRPHPQQARRCEDKPRAAVENLLSLWTPTPTSSLRSPNSSSSLRSKPPENPQQLRQEPRNRLRPRAQALTCPSPQPSCFPPIPAEVVAVGASPRPALLQASPPPLFVSLKSRWAPEAYALVGSRSIRLQWPVLASLVSPSAMDAGRRVGGSSTCFERLSGCAWGRGS